MAFVFVGGDQALDFVNTEVVARGRPADLLGSAADLRRWWDEARERHPAAGLDPFVADAAGTGAERADPTGGRDAPATSTVLKLERAEATAAGIGGAAADGAALLAAAKALRAALRRFFEALARGDASEAVDVDAINAVLRTGHPSLAVAGDGRLRAVYDAAGIGPEAHLLPLALAARDLATRGDVHRLHQCGNRRCVLLFYDATKSATRRWCSVRCMDRSRSSARYAEQKRAAGGSVTST